MTTHATDRHRAARFYSRLVALYPKTHRERFGPHMQRAFEDSYRNATLGERRAGLGFWLSVTWDELCSILRERAAEPQGDAILFTAILSWAVALLIVPTIPAVGDWHNLVLPAGVLAALLLAVPGGSGRARRLLTIAAAAAALECVNTAAHVLKDETHLLAPGLFLVCTLFSIKTLAGLNARMVGSKDDVWGGEELAYGLAVGLAGVVSLAMSAANTNDAPSVAPALLQLGVPVICAVAGYRMAWRAGSARSGIYASLGTMLIGAMIWLLALPLVIEGALLTVLRDHPVPAAALLPNWQGPLSTILFTSAIFAIVGAYFGYIVRVDGSSRSAPRA